METGSTIPTQTCTGYEMDFRSILCHVLLAGWWGLKQRWWQLITNIHLLREKYPRIIMKLMLKVSFLRLRSGIFRRLREYQSNFIFLWSLFMAANRQSILQELLQAETVPLFWESWHQVVQDIKNRNLRSKSYISQMLKYSVKKHPEWQQYFNITFPYISMG